VDAVLTKGPGRPLAALVTVAVVLAGLVGVGLDVPAVAAGSEPRVVAHRGFPGSDLTENTLGALERAEAHQADAAEFDVQVTTDDRLVLMHDETLDRTTTCDGQPNVGELTLAWIRANCVGERDGAAIPSVNQALAWFAASPVDPELEMKSGGWAPEVVTALVALIRKHGLARRITVIAFEARLLRRVEAVAPLMSTGLIARKWRDVRAHRSRDVPGNRLDGFAVQPGQLTAARVRRLHADGYFVEGRTSNDPATWQSLWDKGVDGLGTDALSEYQSWAS
jgi:glycerophosphoryl diester phosphodiesterase